MVAVRFDHVAQIYVFSPIEATVCNHLAVNQLVVTEGFRSFRGVLGIGGNINEPILFEMFRPFQCLHAADMILTHKTGAIACFAQHRTNVHIIRLQADVECRECLAALGTLLQEALVIRTARITAG